MHYDTAVLAAAEVQKVLIQVEVNMLTDEQNKLAAYGPVKPSRLLILANAQLKALDKLIADHAFKDTM